MPQVEIRLLDGVALAVGDRVIPITRRREQTVLARLALAAPRDVPVDVLISDVWGSHPPATAIDALRVHVSQLRKTMVAAGVPAEELLRTGAGAYRLDIPQTAVDIGWLGTAVGDRDVDGLTAFLDRPNADQVSRFDSGSGFFDDAGRHVAELRRSAVEVVAADGLDRGEPERAVTLLQRELGEAPFRERLWQLLIEALSAADRRAEAARTFQRARATLSEVGVEPGPALRGAEARLFATMTSPTPGRLVSEYVDVDGSRVAYATIGSGDADLLFVHGGFVPFETMRDEPRFTRFLDELADRFRVVLVDRRGIGMSDPPADGSAVTIDHWVADFAAVLDAVGSPATMVFAHENAGPPALKLAAEHPHLVTGLILHSTAARPLRAPDHPYGPSEETLQRIDRMIDRAPGVPEMVRLVAPSVGDDERLRAWLDRAGRLGAGPARARQLHRTYMHADVRDVLADVRVPTIVLHPARMVRSDPGQARYLAEHLPDAELELLDSGDHLFWLADARHILGAIDRLRSRVRPSSAARKRRLRALVAVAPQSAAGPLQRAETQSSVTVDGVVVATFDSLSDAERAADDVRHRETDVRVVIETADTTGMAEDPAVERIAERVADE